MNQQFNQIDFEQVGRAALRHGEILVARWLPDGKLVGHEWIALNPLRDDHKPGSFSINLSSGRWSDFAIGVSGGDLISLAAYLNGLTQREAALRISEMLGVEAWMN